MEMSLPIVGFFIGFACLLVGIFIGGFFFESMGKGELRKRVEDQEKRKPTVFAEARREARKPAGNILGEIIAPVLDSAGVIAEGEEIKFPIWVLDISKHGIAVLSQHFITKGLKVTVSCRSQYFSFTHRDAEVRNISIHPRGIRIGLQFFKPLDKA